MRVYIIHTVGHYSIQGVFLSYAAAVDTLLQVRQEWDEAGIGGRNSLFIEEYQIDTTIPVLRNFG